VTDMTHSLVLPKKSEKRIRRDPETLQRNWFGTPSEGETLATSLLMFYYADSRELALGEHE